MPLLTEKFNDWKFGVVNAIEPSDIPKEAVSKSQNLYYRENRWRKMPGFLNVNSSQIADFNVRGLGKFHDLVTGKKIFLAACGTNVYKFTDGVTPESIHSGMMEDDIEFLEYPPYVIFGSNKNLWRKYQGGTTTDFIGGNHGTAADAPRKFSKIQFNDYSGRFFGIGELANPDYLYWSEHIDNEGMEKWPDGNVQIVPSRFGDVPVHVDIYEGRIFIFNQNSMSSGSVSGVPESWSFQSERCQTGYLAPRTVKRYGNSFFGLTPDFEVYQWPTDKFITKGRVKFSINPYRAKYACSEIVEDRYYDICFESGEAVSSDKYHWWRYDILGDKWYGPHTQRNITSMLYDKDDRTLYCGGADNFKGYVFNLRGWNIHTSAMKCHLVTGFNNQGDIRNDKRYSMFRLRSKQIGTAAQKQTDTYTKLLLHCDGTDGSVTFSDSSAYNKTVTPSGDAQIDTAQFKFGTASALFDGTTDYLTSAAHADWNFDGAFTIDLWFKVNTGNNYCLIQSVSNNDWNSASAGDWHLSYAADGNLFFYVKGTGNTSATAVSSPTTWNHVAVVRSGTSIKVYLNGVLGGNLTFAGTLGNTQALEIGRAEANLDAAFNGWIDEVRVSNGIARWTSAFTPPTASYENFTIEATSGQLEVIVNADQAYDNPQSMRLNLQDPVNLNLMDTGSVKDSIIKRAHIHEFFGRGSSLQLEFKHEIMDQDIEISEWELDYFSRTKKEDRNV